MRFPSASSLPEENRFRPRSQEYRNARELRLRVLARGENKGDSDGSGQLEIDMLFSPQESRHRQLGRGPGMGQSTSSAATGT